MSHSDAEHPFVRLDKWLWAARFYKTRSLAQKALEQNKVLYNSQKATSSRKVFVDAIIELTQGYEIKTVVVKKLDDRRRSFEEACQLYEETAESIAEREKQKLKRTEERYLRDTPKPSKRPDKKDRSDLKHLKRQSD